MKKLTSKLAKFMIAAGLVALTLIPSLTQASGEAYYYQDSSHSSITATGGAYGSSQANFTSDGAGHFTASGSVNCASGIGQGDATITPTTPSANPTPAEVKTSCEAGADSSIKIYADKSSAQATATTNAPNNPSCKGGVLSYILCPVYSWILSSIQSIEQNVIVPFLQLNPIVVGQTSNPTYQIWLQFRNLANIGFILAFLVLIFATTLSINLDSYSLKKMLPRLVIVAVLVQFSYVLVAAGVDLSNILGFGIQNLVLAPLKGQTTVVITNLVGGIGIAAGIAGLVAAAGSIITGGILVILISAFFAVLAVFFTLVARQVLITLLLILSPLAFVAWILPNTEHYFKFWRKSLLRLLLMYPFIVLLFASGKLFGAAAVATGGGGVGNDSLRSLISVVANIIPLFLIPFTFKFAGEALVWASGILGQLTNHAKTRTQSSGYHERFQKRVGERRAELAAGEKVKGFGVITGNRAAAQIGRGAFAPPTKGSQVRAMIGFNKSTNDWKKRIEDENMSFEGISYLSLGESWYQKERRDTLNKISTARLAGNTAEVAVQQAALERLDEGKRAGGIYFNNMSARSAATLKRSDMDVLNNDDRLQVMDYTRYNSGSEMGKLIGNQLWGRAKEGARKTNVHLAYTDLRGNLDVENLYKFVIKKSPGDWTNYSKDAIEAMEKNGILQRLASDVSARTTLINIMGTQGGPSIGAEQQSIIRDVLRRVPPPDPHRPDPADL